MAKSIKIKALSTELEIVAEGYTTQNGWGHKAFCRVEDINSGYTFTGTRRYRYYNRTWESFQYQSVILGALTDMLEQINIKGHFKQIYGYKGMSSSRNEEYKEYLIGLIEKYNDNEKTGTLDTTEKCWLATQVAIKKIQAGEVK